MKKIQVFEQEAKQILDELHATIPYSDYSRLHDLVSSLACENKQKPIGSEFWPSTSEIEVFRGKLKFKNTDWEMRKLANKICDMAIQASKDYGRGNESA